MKTRELPDWLPSIVKDEVKKRLASDNFDLGTDDACLIRLASDKRLRDFWNEFSKINGNLTEQIQYFLLLAPALLFEGQSLHHPRVRIDRIQFYERCQKHLRDAIRDLKRFSTLSEFYGLEDIQKYGSNALKQLEKFERSFDEEFEAAKKRKTNYDKILDKKFAALRKLKHEGGSKFDEKFVFCGLYIFFQESFGKASPTTIGNIVMVMKDVPKSSYSNEDLRSRVSHTLGNFKKHSSS